MVMRCPFCQSDVIFVVNSRPTANESQIWRRRKCSKCGEQFTTYEKINLSYLKVIKRSGAVRVYSRAKLFSGIYHSSIEGKHKDRGEMGELSEKLTQEVEKRIMLLKKKRIETAIIGDIVLSVLKKHSQEIFLHYLAYKEGANDKNLASHITKYYKEN